MGTAVQVLVPLERSMVQGLGPVAETFGPMRKAPDPPCRSASLIRGKWMFGGTGRAGRATVWKRAAEFNEGRGVHEMIGKMEERERETENDASF